MFILNLTYKKNLDEVEKFLGEHILYLNKYYASGNFICSGRKNPRNGGIILCLANDIALVEKLIQEDPFKREGIADYEIIEFSPTKCSPKFESVIA
jgi:uncharacterized protein YciI